MLTKQLVDNRYCHYWTGAVDMLRGSEPVLLTAYNRKETSELKHTNGKLNSNSNTKT
ncbi:MAG TPA: hypothetical protein VIM55_03080 [Mucilaginibacter sp.]